MLAFKIIEDPFGVLTFQAHLFGVPNKSNT